MLEKLPLELAHRVLHFLPARFNWRSTRHVCHEWREIVDGLPNKGLRIGDRMNFLTDTQKNDYYGDRELFEVSFEIIGFDGLHAIFRAILLEYDIWDIFEDTPKLFNIFLPYFCDPPHNIPLMLKNWEHGAYHRVEMFAHNCYEITLGLLVGALETHSARYSMHVGCSRWQLSEKGIRSIKTLKKEIRRSRSREIGKIIPCRQGDECFHCGLSQAELQKMEKDEMERERQREINRNRE